MKNLTKLLLILNVCFAVFLGMQTGYVHFDTEHKKEKPEIKKIEKNISVKTPAHLDYPQIIEQLKLWNNEAPEVTEIGVYGKTSQNKDLYYIRISGDLKKECPKVLVTGCIHGDESLSTGCVMAYIGNLLHEQKTNLEVKELLENRDIYFVPVLSPDSYPTKRMVDKVDPNRDFPSPKGKNKSVSKSVQEIQDFFYRIKPDAVLSGHAYGRTYQIPYADNRKKCPNQSDYDNIIKKMSDLSDYKYEQCCNFYLRPIKGTELDWYYRNGAFSLIVEFGVNQIRPKHEQINKEFEKTWKSFKIFLQEAPLVEIKAGFDDQIEDEENLGIENKYYSHQKSILKIIKN